MFRLLGRDEIFYALIESKHVGFRYLAFWFCSPAVQAKVYSGCPVQLQEVYSMLIIWFWLFYSSQDFAIRKEPLETSTES